MSKIDKLTNQAKEHLDEEEKIVSVVGGAYETNILGKSSARVGIFIATDKRLVFYAKKFMGYDFEMFPYTNISSIEMSKGIMGHSISFFASGNKVHMKWIKNQDEKVKEFAEYIRSNIGKK